MGACKYVHRKRSERIYTSILFAAFYKHVILHYLYYFFYQWKISLKIQSPNQTYSGDNFAIIIHTNITYKYQILCCTPETNTMLTPPAFPTVKFVWL